MRKNARAAKMILLLGLISLLPACATDPGIDKLPTLTQKEVSRGLVPQEYLCSGAAQETTDPRLAKEIQAFLEKSGILGGVPAGVANDLPMVLNGPVQKYLHSFAHSKNFQASLARSGRYLPMMRRIFEEHGLPQDLVWVALVESGFNPWARSPMEAVGIWQFIEGTARRYGLKVNGQVDERQDPEKSTRAAARYLGNLYQQFGCWYLAAAGYNAGEKRVEGVMNRHDIQDFWVMARNKLLPQETCNYVPQLVAAALIAQHPEKYGLPPIQYQGPVAYEKVKIPGGTNWRWFAESLEIADKDLLALNPELCGGAIPSEPQGYFLKVPAKKKREAQQLARLCWKMENIAAVEGLW
jgi:hypothetical protein